MSAAPSPLRDRAPGWLVLAAVTAAYAPSLQGGWVWDDHYQIEQNPAMQDLRWLVSTDIRSAGTGEPTDVYRPLAMASHVPGQRLWPGPTSERVGNLALHLAVVVGVSGLARRLGAMTWPAWLGAALLGLHPGASEAVAWISGRHDLLAAALLIAAAGLLPSRPMLAGALAALTPFAKEPYLLAPVALALWAWGTGAWSGRAVAVAALGPPLAALARAASGVALPVGVALEDPLGALGALGVRAVELLVVPTAASALPPYAPAPVAGALAALLGLGLAIQVARGRRPAALALAPLILLLPSAPASARIGLVGDRYFYLLFAAAGVAAAVGMTRWPRARWAALSLPALGLLTAQRALLWRSDAALFEAEYARHPDSLQAAFHLAHVLHVYQDDCAGAAALYREAAPVEPRARTNLMACLVSMGELELAAQVGPELAAMNPADPKVPASTSRALAALGRLDQARAWAERAVAAGARPDDLVLLGNLAGQQGDLDGAERAFRAALALAPEHAGASAGLQAVEARRAALLLP